MKKLFVFFDFLFFISTLVLSNDLIAQNAGIGITSPKAKLHIKGSADTTQLLIDANSIQSNTRPLIKLRNSSGTELLRIHSDDTSNIFIGRNAGRVNIATIGGGTYNTFIGGSAGRSNTTGIYNTANGESALSQNTTGNANTACGGDALIFNTTGINNSAFGLSALAYNNTGNYNTASGVTALYSNTAGSYNTATGIEALFYNTTGNYNTAIGADALLYNTTGYRNTAIGGAALFNNSVGDINVAIGSYSLYSNTTGGSNTAIGNDALYAGNPDNSFNTALGEGAGSTSSPFYIFGCTFIGKQASYASTTEGPISNSSCLGYASFVSADNQVQIGNSSVTHIGGFTGWSNFSDSRIKKNIRANVPGLDFVKRLNPVTYTLDLGAADNILGRVNVAGDNDVKGINAKARKEKEQIVYTGFIAQDVEAAAKEIGFEFSGVDAPKNEHDLYSLRYAEFVVPLVKAVQELSGQNTELKNQTEELQKIISDQKKLTEDLLQRIQRLESSLSQTNKLR